MKCLNKKLYSSLHSRLHCRLKAVLHLFSLVCPMLHVCAKLGANVFIWYVNISILRNLIQPPSTILELLGKSWDHPQRPVHSGYPLWKFRYDQRSRVEVISLRVFVVHMLDSIVYGPIIFSFEGFTPKNYGNRSHSKGTSLRVMTHFETSLAEIGGAV